jgi:hypothetical protein
LVSSWDSRVCVLLRRTILWKFFRPSRGGPPVLRREDQQGRNTDVMTEGPTTETLRRRVPAPTDRSAPLMLKIGIGIGIVHLRHRDSSVSVTISPAIPAASTLLAPPESQRDSVLQPRVAPTGATLGLPCGPPSTPSGLCQSMPPVVATQPRWGWHVPFPSPQGRSRCSQPWASVQCPVGAYGDVSPGAGGRRRHRGHFKIAEDVEDVRRATSCCIVSMVGTRFRV